LIFFLYNTFVSYIWDDCDGKQRFVVWCDKIALTARVSSGPGWQMFQDRKKKRAIRTPGRVPRHLQCWPEWCSQLTRGSQWLVHDTKLTAGPWTPLVLRRLI